MTPERLRKIREQIEKKYSGQKVSPLTVQGIYNDFSAVIRGLHKTEHFLDVSVDVSQKIIIVRDDETMTFLGCLPYLDNRLMEKSDPYVIYRVKGDLAYTACAVTFIDLYQVKDTHTIGFDVDIKPVIPLGIFDPRNNTFEPWEVE